MNLAVLSKRINDALGRRTVPRQPLTETDAWSRWIGRIDKRYVPGWTVELEDWPTVGPQVRDAIVNVAVPALAAHISDESLRDRWLAKADIDDISDHVSVPLGRLLILLEAIGPRDAIPAVRAELDQLADSGHPLAILWRDRQPGVDVEWLNIRNRHKLTTPAAWESLARKNDSASR